jgi:hypothetical protein
MTLKQAVNKKGGSGFGADWGLFNGMLKVKHPAKEEYNC